MLTTKTKQALFYGDAMNKNYSEHGFYKALKKKYDANIEDAIALAQNLFDNPMGIEDHSNITKEIQKYIDIISKNYEDLETLKTYFGD